MYTQYKAVLSVMQDQIPELDVFVDTKDHESGLKDVLKHIKPQWKRDDIKFKALENGFVNLMHIAFISEEDKADWVVCRVFDTKVEILDQLHAEKEFEFKAAKLFSEIGAGPPVLATFKNGLIIEFVMGTSYSWKNLTPFRDNMKLIKAVARAMAKVHSQATYKLAMEKYAFDKAPYFGELMKGMGQYDWADAVLIDEDTTKWFNSKVPPLKERISEFGQIIDYMTSVDLPDVFCHLDPNPTNLLYLEDEERVLFVDFECSRVSKPVMDTAAFLSGAALGVTGHPVNDRFSVETLRAFMKAYLAERNRLDKGSEDVDEKEVDKYCDINEMYDIGGGYMIFAAASVVQSGAGDRSYLEAGVTQLDYYWENKDRMLQLYAKYRSTR